MFLLTHYPTAHVPDLIGLETFVTFCGMVWLRATVSGRLGWKPSPHPRACALSCPPPAIYGPGLGHFTRPALCHLAGAYEGSGPSLYPRQKIVAGRCVPTYRRVFCTRNTGNSGKEQNRACGSGVCPV